VSSGERKKLCAYVYVWVCVRGGKTTTTSRVIAIATTKTWSRMSAFLAHYGAFLCPKCRQVQPGSSGISTNDRCVLQQFSTFVVQICHRCSCLSFGCFYWLFECRRYTASHDNRYVFIRFYMHILYVYLCIKWKVVAHLQSFVCLHTKAL